MHMHQSSRVVFGVAALGLVALCLVAARAAVTDDGAAEMLQHLDPNQSYEHKYYDKMDADFHRAAIMIRHKLEKPNVPMPPQHAVKIDDVQIDRSKTVGKDLRAATKEAEDAIGERKAKAKKGKSSSWNPLSWFESSDAASDAASDAGSDAGSEASFASTASTSSYASGDDEDAAARDDYSADESSVASGSDDEEEEERRKEMADNLAKQRRIRHAMRREESEISALQARVHARQTEVATRQQDVANREARIAAHLQKAASAVTKDGVSAAKAKDTTTVHIVRNGPVNVHVNAAPKHDLVIDVDNEAPRVAKVKGGAGDAPAPSLSAELGESDKLLHSIANK